MGTTALTAKRSVSIKRAPLSIADALFTSTQQRVLALLFGQPERSFFAKEIIGRLGAGSGAVQRELKKLTDSALVNVSRVGNQTHYQANASSPIYSEMIALMRKTVGLAEPLRQALAPKRRLIELAFVYGSVAKKTDTATSDIDVLIVSDKLTLEDIYRVFENVEVALGRKINPMLYTSDEFRRRLSGGNPFLKRVLSGHVMPLIGALPHE